jgi:hypothetical protein
MRAAGIGDLLHRVPLLALAHHDAQADAMAGQASLAIRMVDQKRGQLHGFTSCKGLPHHYTIGEYEQGDKRGHLSCPPRPGTQSPFLPLFAGVAGGVPE